MKNILNGVAILLKKNIYIYINISYILNLSLIVLLILLQSFLIVDLNHFQHILFYST